MSKGQRIFKLVKFFCLVLAFGIYHINNLKVKGLWVVALLLFRVGKVEGDTK